MVWESDDGNRAIVRGGLLEVGVEEDCLAFINGSARSGSRTRTLTIT